MESYVVRLECYLEEQFQLRYFQGREESENDSEEEFDTVDEFCRVLSPVDSLKSFTFSIAFLGVPVPTEIPEECVVAWTRLLSALGDLVSIKMIHLYGDIQSAAIFTQVFEAMSNVQAVETIFLTLSWPVVIDGEVLYSMAQALLQLPAQLLHLHIDGDADVSTDDQLVHVFLSKLCGLGIFFDTHLELENVRLSQTACEAFANLLRERSQGRELLLDSCEFPKEGGRLIAEAICANESLNYLDVHDMFGDEAFCTVLLSGLPMNTVLSELVMHNSAGETFGVESFFIDLLKNIVEVNRTVKWLDIADENSRTLTDADKQELEDLLQGNFTLYRIAIDKEEPFEAITRLNIAGRGYLIENAPTKLDCIQVLLYDFVQDHLDSIFYHFREANGILLAGDAEQPDREALDEQV